MATILIKGLIESSKAPQCAYLPSRWTRARRSILWEEIIQ